MERVVRWDRGTLLLEGCPESAMPPGFQWDDRVRLPRARAIRYHDVVLDLHRRGVPYRDEARAYEPLDRAHHTTRTAATLQQFP